ncbi:MAG: SurA N-terminal domain-containing protein, partial [Deltaproteobacteria bacterium]|nr:SurA N-terminal domain-containing protein [Deltaproteobacteria bacterium]
MLDIIRANAQSWGVKIVFGLIIVVFVFWGVGSYRATDPSTLLKINGTPIQAQDFAHRYKSQVDTLRARYPNL